MSTTVTGRKQQGKEHRFSSLVSKVDKIKFGDAEETEIVESVPFKNSKSNPVKMDSILAACQQFDQAMARPGKFVDVGKMRSVNWESGRARITHQNVAQDKGKEPVKEPTKEVSDEEECDEVYVHVRGEYDGDLYVNEGNVLTAKPHARIIKEGIHWRVLRHGPGWAVLSKEKGKGKRVFLSAFMQRYEIRAYYNVNQQYVGKQVFILPKAMVDEVKITLRPTMVSEAVSKAIYVKAANVYSNVDDELIKRVLKFYTARSTTIQQMAVGETLGLNMELKNFFGPLGDDETEYQETTETGGPHRLRDKQFGGSVEYEVGDGLEFTGKDYHLNEHGNPVFDDQTGGKLRFHTRLTSLEGERKFCVYGDTPHNMNAAMKRTCGQREGEREYRDAQDEFGYAFYDALRWNDLERPLHALGEQTIKGLERAARMPKLTRSVWCDPHLKDKYEKIAYELVKVINRCDRTTIDAVLANGYKSFSWAYFKLYEEFETWVMPHISRNTTANIAHIRKRLRQAYVRKYDVHSVDELMVRLLEGKVKRETAKGGSKVPRIYVGYEAGCMFANELPEFVKMCLTEAIVVTNDEGERFTIVVFSKPKCSEINDYFIKCLDGLPSGEHFVLIYSDDSCWFGNTLNDYRYSHNVDISSCDASNGPTMFAIVGAALAKFDPERAFGLVNQCNLPIRFYHPGKTGAYIQVTGERPIQGSGTVLTTIINHFSSVVMALSYAYSNAYGGAAIVEACADVGFKVTCSENFVDCPEKIQFLKYSWVRDIEGKWVQVRNAGAILRNFGKVDGDLTSLHLGVSQETFNLMAWPERMDLYLSGIVQSYVYEPRGALMNALRDRFGIPAQAVVVKQNHIELDIDRSSVTIDDTSFCSRYDISLDQLHELCDQIRNIKVGTVCVLSALTSIYKEDYDL